MNQRRSKPPSSAAIVRENLGTELALPPCSGLAAGPGHYPPSRVDPELVADFPYRRPQLASFTNGRLGTRSFEEARELFHRCVYAWLLPLDTYRWSIDGHVGTTVVSAEVPRASRRFGLLLHTRATKKLTMRALEKIEGISAMSNEVFHARAARFNALFGKLPVELRPFRFYEFDDHNGCHEPTYQMRPNRPYIIVVGPADDTPADEVDWQYFLTSPEGIDRQLLK
ncbi:MAG: hypothetical protein AABZ47_05090 [Planctomycetota bacterium]